MAGNPALPLWESACQTVRDDRRDQVVDAFTFAADNPAETVKVMVRSA